MVVRFDRSEIWITEAQLNRQTRYRSNNWQANLNNCLFFNDSCCFLLRCVKENIESPLTQMWIAEMKSSRTQFEVLGLEACNSSKNALSSAREQHYFLTCWKWVKVMTNFVLSWRTPERLQKTFWRNFSPGERLNFLKIYEFWERRPFFFFFLRTPEFSGKFANFWSEDLFFSRSLPRCVFGLGFFLCPWPCVLDSTSGELNNHQ